MTNKEKFLLKDYLFNRDKVKYLAGLIKEAYFYFDDEVFVKKVVKK